MVERLYVTMLKNLKAAADAFAAYKSFQQPTASPQSPDLHIFMNCLFKLLAR